MKRARLLALAAVAACARAARAQTASLPVRLGAATDDQSKPVLYAKQAGLFEKAGLDVALTTLNGGGAAIAAAVIGGSLDIGKSNCLQLISAHVRGLPFVVIAPAATAGTDSREAGTIVANNGPIRSARDLNGKTVGVTTLVTIEIIGTKAWIDANGGDSSSIKFVEVSPAATQAAIEQGRIAAGTILEPQLSAALATGNVRLLAYPYGAIAKRFEGADWFTTVDYVAKHRDVVERFERVVHDANVYVAAHESETIPLIAAYTGIDPATLARMRHPERPAYLNAGELQALIDAAARYAFIPKPFPARELYSDVLLRPGR
jgi:NitT/TauT family transport system substrate-binding protein